MDIDKLIKQIQTETLQGNGVVYIGKIYSSKNGRFFSSKSKRLLKSKNTQLFEREALRQFEMQKNITDLKPSKHVHFIFSFGDKRRRDLPNMVQGIMDALVKAGIYSDDNYKNLIPHHYVPMEGKIPFVIILFSFNINHIMSIKSMIYSSLENQKKYNKK